MFDAKVYNVMVGSLSGIMKEITVVKEVIQDWNQKNAERSGKVFLNVDWATKAEDAQKIDVVIGIVGNWVENTELIEACIKERTHVILFFSAYQDPGNTIASELDKVKAFRESIQEKCSCIEFRGATELKQLVEEELSI